MTIDLTTLAKVRALGAWDVSDTTDDALLTRLITSYSSEFERILDRHTEATAYTEVYRLRQGEKIVTLRGAPVSVVTTVKYTHDKDWSGATALTETTEYLTDLDEGVLQFLIGTGYAPGYVQVVYTGGMAATETAFATAFPSIGEACAAQVINHWNRHRSPEGSVTVAGGSTTVDGQLSLLKWVRETLENYKRWRI